MASAINIEDLINGQTVKSELIGSIYKTMEQNGSPGPTFDTDDSSYVMVTLPARIAEEDNGATNGANSLLFSGLSELIEYTNGATNGAGYSAMEIVTSEIHDQVTELLDYAIDWTNRGELFGKMILSNQSSIRQKYLDPLLSNGWIEMEFPDRVTHPNQRYRVSTSGKRLRKLLADN